MADYSIPMSNVGPGSQPVEEDGADLDVMPMPAEMTTYTMPDVSESIESLNQANEVLRQLQELLDTYHADAPVGVIDISALDANSRTLIDQVLGEGEVSIVYTEAENIRIQEAVLAGVWRVQYVTSDGDANNEVNKDIIEVSDIPVVIKEATFQGDNVQKIIGKREVPAGVNNAIPLISELNDKIAQIENNTAEPHVINLTLLPQSDNDIEFLTQVLGKGPVTILSRGYGNCRITSTATHNVWWVQYFNSQDTTILNTLEVTPVPIVACASVEDIADSAQRLQEIREVYA